MIKTLIFDFGDVFINLDKPAFEREFANLGFSEITEKMLQVTYKYEAGKISTNDILNHFRDVYGLSSDDFIKAWNSIILDFPEYRLEFIEELRSSNNYNLILLSNTNDLHIDYVKETMGLERYERFKSCFNRFYLSHEIKFRKPNADIFEFVLNSNNLIPQECLFVDDIFENTQTAKSLDINVWNNDPNTEDVVDLLSIKKDLF
jgi:putative hydrolase of the HAD superfamily